jgi:hypothetical protein
MILSLAELERDAGNLDRARDLATDALKHANRVQNALARARVYGVLGVIEKAAGRREPAAGHRRAAVEELRRIGDRHSAMELEQLE